MGLESLLGGLADNLFAKSRQEDAQAFSAQQYATRYQTQTEDMKKAGINPMLSVSSGAGSQPTSTASSPGSNFTQAALNSAQIANINADTENKDAQRKLLEAQASQANASAGQATANVGQINATVEKIGAEIAKIKGDTNFDTQQDILKQTAWMLQQQGVANQERGMTEGASRAQIAQTIQKLIQETKLASFDVKAAESLSNLGRTSKELQPVIQMLVQALRK